MHIEFYHIDAFEVAQYEPIWRELLKMGVDARIVGAPGPSNTAAPGWFDFELFQRYCQQRGIPFHTAATPTAQLAVTTQNENILRDYVGKHVRLMYGPIAYPAAWGLQEHSVRPFDAVLTHGPAYSDFFAQWQAPRNLPVIGYPRYDDFFAGRLQRGAIRARWGVDDSRPVLAFLPTWGPNTGFDAFLPALLRLAGRYQIVLRPHHCTLHFEPQRMAQLRASGLTVLDNAFDLPEVYAGADVVLSDVRSGGLFEAAMCDVPAVGMVCDAGELSGWLAERHIDAFTRLCVDPAELERAIDDALESNVFAAARRRWAEHHVSYRDGSAARRAAEALIEQAAPAVTQVAVPRVYGCKVSIVLPTYNHVDFLPQAVAAILTQTYTDFELIIVNDGSRDATPAYLATLTDPRIRIINRENGGLPSALNCGFAGAVGEYRTWTSADNITAPTWLEQLVGCLDAAPPEVGFASSGFALINEQGMIHAIRRGQKIAYDHVLSKNPGIASFLYRTTVAEQVGEYDVTLLCAEDWDMWLRILEVCDGAYVDYVLYYYRQHGNTMSSTMPAKVVSASVAVLEKVRQRHGGEHFDLNKFYPRLGRARDPALAQWQAKARLATALLDSPFCPPAWTVALLIEALRDKFSVDVHRNLILLLCLHNAWDLALGSIDEVRQHVAPEQFDILRALVANRDPAILQKLPVYRIPEHELAFALGRA